jgi:hypothetical protein
MAELVRLEDVLRSLETLSPTIIAQDKVNRSLAHVIHD